MSTRSVDPLLLEAWLSARSIARGLPLPTPDHGGFRVDTNSDAEIARWVFAQSGPGLEDLARSIDQPRYFLKLCGSADELQAVLPAGWVLHAPSYFMQAGGESDGKQPGGEYRIETSRTGMVSEARIYSGTGILAASGYAAETADVFIYDRIVTDPLHRRKGLGRAIMAALRATMQHAGSPELLVATEEGRSLYATLGWKVISSYSTASRVTP